MQIFILNLGNNPLILTTANKTSFPFKELFLAITTAFLTAFLTSIITVNQISLNKKAERLENLRKDMADFMAYSSSSAFGGEPYSEESKLQLLKAAGRIRFSIESNNESCDSLELALVQFDSIASYVYTRYRDDSLRTPSEHKVYFEGLAKVERQFIYYLERQQTELNKSIFFN